MQNYAHCILKVSVLALQWRNTNTHTELEKWYQASHLTLAKKVKVRTKETGDPTHTQKSALFYHQSFCVRPFKLAAHAQWE